ncbi:MAG TPA: response regulator [Chitinophagaceae bacterium]|nr:response regulator [Chitinophagaceae bacterium]
MLAKTAMIIDDDEDLGRLLMSMLEARKILALPVQTLHEAEEYLSYMKPTVIFLDNSFPEGLGINFIRNIHLADEEIKIIMMTADSAKWIEEKARAEGVNYFLRKPFDKEVIDNILDKLELGRDW